LAGILLSGCSSSGGGGKPHIDAGDLVFKSWSQVPSSGAVIVGGTAQKQGETETHESNTIIAYENGSIVKIEINVDGTKIATWDTRTGDTIDASGAVIDIYSGKDPSKKENLALMGNPTDPANKWEYQTYGAWMVGQTATTTPTFGSVSMGAQTAGSAIPLTGTATFEGSAGGIYVDASTKKYTASSDMKMVADFTNRSLSFETTGSKTRLDSIGNPIAANDLNMQGTLKYLPGVNKFVGTVDATGLSGSSTGYFYGPNAEEVGGVFDLKGTGGTYVGAYGGKKQ